MSYEDQHLHEGLMFGAMLGTIATSTGLGIVAGLIASYALYCGPNSGTPVAVTCAATLLLGPPIMMFYNWLLRRLYS